MTYACAVMINRDDASTEAYTLITLRLQYRFSKMGIAFPGLRNLASLSGMHKLNDAVWLGH